MSQLSDELYRQSERELWESYGAQPIDRFVTLENPPIRVRVLEVGQGEPVLFVHGGPNAGSTWAPLVGHLQDFRCLVLDRPGCGLSEAVRYGSADLPSLAADILASVLSALELERVPVVSSSIGGTWTFWLALAHPERVSWIVQEGCPALVPGMRMPAFMRLLAMPGLNRMATLFPSNPVSVRMILRQTGHGASLKQALIPEIMTRWSCALLNNTRTMTNELGMIEHALTWRGPRRPSQLREEQLARITQPTLFLWGEDDPFGSPELGKHLAGAMPRAILKAFPASGHLPWLDRPREHADAIRTFLHSAGAVV